MAIPYETTGRTRQKSRTRQVLVEATRELLAQGSTPQVEDAAERAGVSRTTAYRYFPNQRSLLMAAHPQISPDTLLGQNAPVEPYARLDAFMAAFTQYNLDWEPQLRTSLRLSLDEPRGDRPALRQGRAIGWLEHALEPLRRNGSGIDVHALAIAVRSATGIETLIWLVDIAGQSRQEAGETVRRTARALLAAALTEAAAR
ncbi:TetR/AcrR family transcriptional regulator [Dactylosporangium sp. NPDC005555]|uniref:TetR/AcrR family transcriptional regulator n=1 Tax=Dactylosporangium sp. NPDC005555 TaxID=3154889 RepID=UPI0033B6413B